MQDPMGFCHTHLEYTKYLLTLINKWEGGKKAVVLVHTDPAMLLTPKKPSFWMNTFCSSTDLQLTVKCAWSPLSPSSWRAHEEVTFLRPRCLCVLC